MPHTTITDFGRCAIVKQIYSVYTVSVIRRFCFVCLLLYYTFFRSFVAGIRRILSHSCTSHHSICIGSVWYSACSARNTESKKKKQHIIIAVNIIHLLSAPNRQDCRFVFYSCSIARSSRMCAIRILCASHHRHHIDSRSWLGHSSH